MNLKKIIFVVFFLGALGFFLSKFILKKNSTDNGKSETFMGAGSYYTCPMHPQIHADKPGQCPICAMTLVKVLSQNEEATTQERAHGPMTIAGEALTNAGIGVYEVEKKDLSYKIPFSGRFLSKNSFSFQAYEAELRYIKAGLPVTLSLSVATDVEMTGHISSIDSFVDPASRTIRVVATLNGGSNIMQETSGSGFVLVELKDRIVVPEAALVRTGSRDLVYAITKGNQVAPKTVKAGIRANGYYEILNGLDVGEKISSGPNFLLDSEAKIRGLND